MTESNRGLIVEKLKLNDTFTDHLGERVKVFSEPQIIKAKTRKKEDKTWERYKAITCLVAKVNRPLMLDKNGDPILGIKTFDFYHGLYRITEDRKINLGNARDFIPAS